MTERIWTALAELPELYRRIINGDIDTPTRAARTTHGDNHRPPVSLGLVDALDTRRKHHAEPTDPNRQGILPTLDQWAVLLHADMCDQSPNLPTDLPEPPTIDDLCAWLHEHAWWWQGKPEWDEFEPAIVQQWGRAKNLAGVRTDDVQRCNRVGGCGDIIEHVGGRIYRCRGCGLERSLDAIMAVTLPKAAELTGTSLRTLQSWASRCLLTPIDESAGPRGRRYDINEVRRVIDASHARAS